MNSNSISFPEKLQNYAKASYPALWIKSHEEGRVTTEIIKAFSEAKSVINIYTWDAVNDLLKSKKSKDKEQNDVFTWEKISGDTKVMNIINYCRKLGVKDERTVIIIKDFHAYIDIILQTRNIRNALEDFRTQGTMLIFVSPIIKIPVELERDIQFLDFKLPNEEQLNASLSSIDAAVKIKYPQNTPVLTPDIRQAAVEAVKGMTHVEAHDAFSLAIVENKKYDLAFVKTVFNEKTKQMKRLGLLEYIESDITFDNIGGMDELKKWVKTRAKAYTVEARKFGLPYPKGAIFCGIPGCGKTTLAKAIANELGFALFKLDIGSLFGKHVGESEENFRRVIEIADNIGRCVLFIDEIEKALNRDAVSGVGDTGTSSRSFATFLSWMSDRTSQVFILATSNDHRKLPLELTRKGRFDELFWIDLPNMEDRMDIIKVLLIRHQRDPLKFNIKEITNLSEGYTGAEIEQAIIEAMFYQFSIGKEVTTVSITDALGVIQPLSKMAAEDIDKMRKAIEGKLRPVTSLGSVKSINANSQTRDIQLSL